MDSMKYNEYQMLRNESMEYFHKKEEVRKFTITTTIGVLTLANSDMWESTATLYLIPSIVIVLGIINTIGMEKRTKEIIAYRIVFLENGDSDIRWARAVTRYDKKSEEKIKLVETIQQFDYVILSMLCIVLYISKFWDDVIKLLDEGLYFSPLIFLSIILILLFSYTLYLSVIRKKLATNEQFKKYIKKWKKIKKSNLDF